MAVTNSQARPKLTGEVQKDLTCKAPTQKKTRRERGATGGRLNDVENWTLPAVIKVLDGFAAAYCPLHTMLADGIDSHGLRHAARMSAQLAHMHVPSIRMAMLLRWLSAST